MMMMMKKWEELKPIIVMVAVELGFAVMNLLLKNVVEGGMDHLVFITYRQSIATVFLAPIAYFWERKNRPKMTLVVLFQLFLSAILGASLTQYLFLLGIQYTSATFSCAFINMVPVTTFLMAIPFGLEKVNIKSNGGQAKVVGALVCLGGAMTLTLYKGAPLFKHSSRSLDNAVIRRLTSGISTTSSTKFKWTVGSIALVSATLLWSSWFLVQSNIAKTYPCQYSSTTIMSFFGSLQSAVLALSLNGRLSVAWALKGKMEILIIIYAGTVGSGLCVVAMSWCVKKRGPLFTTAFSPLVQIMAAVIGIPFFHEQLHLGSLLGSIIVIIGLYILLWGKNQEITQSCGNKISHVTVQDPSSVQVPTSEQGQIQEDANENNFRH